MKSVSPFLSPSRLLPREQWLAEAEDLRPTLYTDEVEPVQEIHPRRDPETFFGWSCGETRETAREERYTILPGESLFLDVGVHLVGGLRLETEPSDVTLQIRLGESVAEICESPDVYPEDLGGTWMRPIAATSNEQGSIKIQQRRAYQFIRIDLPQEATEPVSVHSIISMEQSAVPKKTFLQLLHTPPPDADDLEQRIDEVSLRTLRNCMQKVFEDGPKRDRRLWLGDLRLQAPVNYLSFKNYDLVKRCLLLLAGCAREKDGMIPGCVFARPDWHHGDEFIPDYSWLFGPTLLDYVEASGDMDLGKQLWGAAMTQFELFDTFFDDQGVFRDPGTYWLFIDWHEDLDRQVAEQGVATYSLHRMTEWADRLGRPGDQEFLRYTAATLVNGARQSLWDENAGVMRCHPSGQVSWASQIWAILGGLLSPEEGRYALEKVMKDPTALEPRTPYLHHHLLAAMEHCGMKEEARERLRSYWGGMLDHGATAFWEVYNPEDPLLSPYGSILHNSYCHAWSCTPSLFLRT